jgi:hypothetical protein
MNDVLFLHVVFDQDRLRREERPREVKRQEQRSDRHRANSSVSPVIANFTGELFSDPFRLND